MKMVTMANRKIMLRMGAVLLCAVLCFAMAACGSKSSADSDVIEMTPLAKGDLSNSVTTTCTVSTANSQNVATSLAYPIKEVYVAVGDVVNEGQLLCVIDTTALKDQLRAASKTLTDAQTTYSLAVSRAQRSVDNAQNDLTIAQNDMMKDATTALDAAKTALEQAYVNEAADYAATIVDAQYATCPEKTALDAAAADLATKLAAYNAAPDDATKKADYETALSVFNTAQTAADTYKTNLQATLKTQKYNDLKAGLGVTQTITTAQQAVTQAQTNYDAAHAQAYPANATSGAASIRAQMISIESAKDALADAQRNTTAVDAAKLTVKTLQDQINKANITAPISGTVTVCNAVKDLTKPDILFTISNGEELQVSGLLNEYDATRVSTSMRAEITTDATGDSVMHGQVQLVSPKATDSSGDFTVTVKINDPVTALKEGMVGKVKIIVEESKNCFYVPTESIGTDDDGNSVIYVMGDDNKVTAITVFTGLVTDYYTEIEAESLTEGMNVLNTPQA